MADRELLPDEVWAQLRPEDARLTMLSYAQLRLLGAAVVLLATCAALSMMSGFLTPQLYESTSTSTADFTSRTVSRSVEISNDGWFAEHIDRIDTAGPGLRLIGQSGDLVIGRGERATLQVTYQVTDCSVVRRDQSTPMLLRLRRPWGHRTTSLQAGMSSPGLAWTACHGPS